MKRTYKQSAFTIVELLVVIVVIGILAAITIVSYTGITQKATVASLVSDLDNASKQLKLFQISNGNYPATIDCMQADSATNKCIKSSNGTTYEYYVNNTASNQNFCVTALKSNYYYSINNNGSTIPTAYCPVLYLDAGNAASYPGTGTTWTDLSGNGNNGTLNGGVTFKSDVGGVMNFNGLVNDTVNVPDSPELKITSALTSEAWLYFSADYVGYAAHPIVKQSSTSDSSIILYYFGTTSGSNERIRFYANAGGVWKTISGAYQIILNQWVHVVLSYTSTGGGQLYVNGVLQGASEGNGALAINNQALIFGQELPGKISNTRIYNRALSATEILQNFNTQKARYGL